MVAGYGRMGATVAQQLLQPTVTEFIDVVSQWGGADLNFEEVQLEPGSALTGVPLSGAPIRSEMNVIVVGLRREKSVFVFNPSHDQMLEAGDILIVLGRADNLRRLAQLAAGGGA